MRKRARRSRHRTRIGALAVGLITPTMMIPASPALAEGVAFDPAWEIALGDKPSSIAVADFDRDGKPDLAVAGAAPDAYTAGSVWLLSGKGTGDFEPPVALELGAGVGNPNSVAVGDFNKDNNPDLAVLDFDAANWSEAPVFGRILLGDGTGSFSGSPVEVAYGIAYALTSEVGDVNQDGVPDLVAAGAYPRSGGLDPLGFVSGVLGDGSGALPTRHTFVGGEVDRSVALGDLNLDGLTDLVTATSGREDFPGRAQVWWGDGSGQFGPSAGGLTGADAGEGSASVALGDFDGNGTPDVVVANYTSDNVTVFLGNGSGLPAGQSYPAHNGPRSVAVSDFDGDGRQDVAVANAVSGDVSVLPGNGSGAFAAPLNLDAGEMDTLAASRYFGDGGLLQTSDLDCNGRPDLVVANGVSRSVSVLMNAAPGTDPPGCQAEPPDTTAPDTTITSGPGNGSTIRTRSATFGFSATEAGSTFECHFDAAAYGPCVSPEAYTGLADGSHTFRVRATDGAGNTDASPATRTFTVAVPDTTAPNTTITKHPRKTTFNRMAKFAFKSSEPGSRFKCKVDRKPWKTCTSPYTVNVKPGKHTFRVRAIDAAGNVDRTPAVWTWRVKRRSIP